MTPSERKRFMEKLRRFETSSLPVSAIISEMEKLEGWRAKARNKIELAYVAAHEAALKNLFDRCSSSTTAMKGLT